jgi:hypothetical protein
VSEQTRLTLSTVRSASISPNHSIEASSHAIAWDGRNDQGQAVASGVFIYQLRTGTFVQTRRMTLTKYKDIKRQTKGAT